MTVYINSLWLNCFFFVSDLLDCSLIAEARMRNKAMKREAIQAAREAKKERGEYKIAYCIATYCIAVNTIAVQYVVI